MELREAIGILIEVIVLLVEQLVLPFPTTFSINDHIEIERGDRVLESIFRRNQYVAAINRTKSRVFQVHHGKVTDQD